jgi:hypothetical protein
MIIKEQIRTKVIEHSKRRSRHNLFTICLLLIIMIVAMLSCSPSKGFYRRKYHHETARSINQRKGFMLLENWQMSHNREFNSKHNIKARAGKLKR